MRLRQAATLTSLFIIASSLSCRSSAQCSSCHSQKSTKQSQVSPEPLPPSLEDELGVAGAPIDQSDFDFEPEPAEEAQQLEVDGIPPIPDTLKAGLAPYLNSRRARLQSVGSNAKWMTFVSRIGQTAQAFRVDTPLGEPKQLTFTDEPIVQFASIPSVKGGYTLRTDVGGSEDYQILRLDREKEALMLTDGRSRHGPFVWSPGGKSLAFTGNARKPAHMDLYLAGADRDSEPELLLERKGSWTAGSWSPDGERLLMRNYLAFNHSMFHIVDVANRESKALAPLEAGVGFTRARFGADGSIYTISNRDGEFLNLWQVDPDADEWVNLTEDLKWDVDQLTVHRDTGRVAYTTNENGVSRLWLHSEDGRVEIELPMGVVSSPRFARAGEVLAFTLDRPTHTGDAYLYDLTDETLTRWTNSMPAELDSASFVEPKPIKFESFDGLEVPAWAYTPDGPGPHPVLIWMHGGPESQYQPTFNPILQYLVTELGIAVIGPNVRGSTGYGTRYVSLDNQRNRENSVRDIGALLDWIEANEAYDAERVGIYGGSYGGYAVLAAMIRYADRIAAGCDMVGISNFVTFLENTRSYRRDNRRAEYGDETDPEMRKFLEEISPLTHAKSIVKPLFIVHGANDPRVPLSEARQMFEAVKENGQDAWLMVAHDEGHGFGKSQNRDAFYRAFVMFFGKHLVQTDTPTDSQADSTADLEADSTKPN